MLEYCIKTLQHAAMQPVGLLFALLLGMVSAATSACCALPVMGILVGYSGAREEKSRRAAAISVIFFTVGIILSLMTIGGIAGFVGQTAQVSLGGYWKLFAGIIAIVFGLATLKLLPFNLPVLSLGKSTNVSDKLGTATTGLLMGGGVVASSLPCCNPGIFIILGAAILQGQVIWATLLLALFALGFSLPLGTVLLGVSLGKTALVSKNADAAIRWVSGCFLLVAGFYLLVTF
ncbi:cytochrome c biogenesis CcdA family protein [Geotalea uraniireducens]|nr:cytochrome c biogenesis protein CcdA [Geotalea uraniireducens]